MAEHAQAMTSSWLCVLPRIIPAPQVLLKPTRPTRMPQVNAAVVGVENGTFVQTLNYFPNILHPIEDLPAFAFKVYDITHSKKRIDSLKVPTREATCKKSEEKGIQAHVLPLPVTAGNSTSVDTDFRPPRRRPTMSEAIKKMATHTNEDRLPPHVPAKKTSPLNVLSIFSFALTIGLFALSVRNQDGTAMIALFTISLASSIVGYASMWSPQLKRRNSYSNVPRGDVVIRTREGW
jgi:hypothetical protein